MFLSFLSDLGLVGFLPMDELVDNVVVGVGVNLTLVGAELTPSYIIGNALHAIKSVQGYATGKNEIVLCEPQKICEYDAQTKISTA